MSSIRKAYSPFTNRFRVALAYLLVLFTVIGISPVNVLAQAQATPEENTEAITMQFMGETVEVIPTDSSMLRMNVDLFGNTEFVMNEYVWLDGRRISVSNDRIGNIVPVVTPIGTFADNPRSRTGALPPVSRVIDVDARFYGEPVVDMNSNRVSSRRYMVEVDGVFYEAFCANPNLPGPESNASVYEITGEAPQALFNSLRYGFPVNPYLSDPSIGDTEYFMRWAYITRVAVAMAANPSGNFTGDATALSQARQLADGQTARDFDNTKPAITVNGIRHADDLGREISGGAIAASLPFSVDFYRRHHQHTNPFRFEWAPGTPAGTRLLVNGSVVATAAQNITAPTLASPTVFSETVSFTLDMPNETALAGATAKVYLVGVHNQYANRIWLMQNPNDRDNWQDIVFFIPYIRSSAAFSFNNEPYENGNGNGTPCHEPRDTVVRIQKIDALSRENIPGALMRLRGMSSHTIVTGDGEGDRYWVLNNTGINVSQVLTAGATTAVPGDVVSVVEDGVWTLTGLPYGFYMVEEERAPDGFSLLPQHTAFGFWLLPPTVTVEGVGRPVQCPVTGEVLEVIVEYTITEGDDGVNHILITFENYPFGEIVVYKHCAVTNRPLADTHFRIEGFFAEGNAPVITDRVYVTNSAGRVVFRDLPAGTFTISEVQPSPGFMLSEPNFQSVNLSWGQRENNPARPAPVLRFYNEPYTYLQLLKIDGKNNAPLVGAIFMLSDPATGEEWLGTTGSDGRVIIGQEGSQGNFLIPGRTYILREVKAPTQPRQYILNSEPKSVVLSNRGRNEIVIANYHNPSLTIIKRDAADQRLLAGAVFSVEFEHGRPIAGSPFTTDSQGRIVIPNILGDNETERTLIVTEQSPPPGFNLSTPNWQRVTVRAGEDNITTFFNERKPTLTIQKIDARTGYPINGAWFEIEFLGATAGTGSGNIGPSGPLTGNPFITGRVGNRDGVIVIEGVYSGRYRIREVRAANNYWLDPLEQNRTWIIEVRDNEDYTLIVENTLLPTLVITKRNALTWRPVPMTQFRVDFEVPNSPHVQHIGYFMTNMQGQIILPFVQSGWYRVTETRPAPGMTLASNNSFRVFLQPGDNSYTLIREGVIASSSMIIPTSGAITTPPPASYEPAFEPDETDEEREYLPGGNTNTPNAPTPDIPGDADIEAIEPDTDAIVDSDLVPEVGNPSGSSNSSNSSNSPNSSNPSNFPDDFFNRIDFENIEITHYDNPALYERMSRQMQVWGGDHFWNNDLNVWNFPQNSLIIRKENAITGELLQGATFSVTQISSGNDSGLAGTIIGYFTTGSSGIIVISGLNPGYFVIEEKIPPNFFTLSTNNRQHVFLRPDGTSIVEVTFSNLPYSSMIITLRCSVTGAPIPRGEFRVTNSAGAVVGTDNGHFWTNLQGEILIPNVIPDSYVITQVTVPNTHVINLVQSTQTIRVNPTGQIYRVDFFSDPLSQLLITLRCEVSGQPIQGGEFRVTNSTGNVVGSANGIFFTDLRGEILIPGLGVDSYVVTQINAANGFRLGEQNSHTIFVSRPAESYSLNFTNEPYSGIIIQNLDGYNGDPLPGVRFRVDRINEIGNVLVGEYVTDHEGRIELIGLLGSFTVSQIDVPNGWEHDPQPTRIVHVNPGTPTLATFVSPRMGSLEITLSDEDGSPLAGGRFEVRRQNGQLIGEFVTPVSGMISIPNLGSGWVTVEQVAPAPNHVMTDTGRSVEVATNTVARAHFVNIRRPALIIEKVDTEGNPLQGAEFEVRTIAGALVYRGVTCCGGVITIDRLEPMALVLTESRAPSGFAITEPSRKIEIVAGQTLVERFVNPRIATFVLHKIDGDTGASLPEVVFEITTLAGERIRNPQNNSFEFVTDNAGKIRLPLDAGSFVAVELRPLPGFRGIDPVPFVVGHDRDYVITVRNYRYAELTILKRNSITMAPLGGVVFEISRPDGTRLVNPQTGFHDFVSDRNGLIFLPSIEDGRFYLRELRALPGFLIDNEVTPFTIDASARQREHVLVVENTPASGLLVIVTDAQTGRPMQGVEVEIRHADGRLVTGQMINGNQPGTPANSPQLAPNGNFVTDSSGRVNLNHLSPGVYHVRLPNSMQGYQANTDVHVVTVTAGQQAVLELQIAPLAGLRLLKVCAVTGEGIFNVEFMVFDSNGKVVGVFYTDHAGIIDFSAILAPGRYTIRETRPAPGFSRDDVPRTVEFVAGRVTEIRWENIPIAGQLQILKVSGDANQHNSLPAGTPLQGAIFEIFEARTGNLVDRIISNERGMAVSRPLPLGRYIAREVAAPAFYMINPQEIHFDLEHENQIVRVTFPNFSANMGVTIRKTGPAEVMQGHNIFYEIPVVRNDSTTPLADFFWRDVLPTNAVRADRLITGTYNHALRYRVMATTNRGNTIVVADNLSTLTNNVIELRPVHLGLGANEYIVDITLFFGQVPAGFTSVERPRIYVDVLNANQAFLPDGMMFANKVDAGGRIPGTDEWVIGNATQAGTVFNPTRQRIPQSGW